MNTHKFTGDMTSQIERDRDELVALRSKCERLERELAASNTVMDAIQKEEDGLRAKCERLEGERDAAIKEANRRDQKWMDGINEIVGRKLDYDDPSGMDPASTGLQRYVKGLEAQCAEMRSALDRISKLGKEPPILGHGPSILGNSIANQIAYDAITSTDCGKSILARLEEAQRLLSRHKELAHEVVAFGFCDCDIPKGETCIPCQFTLLNKATEEWLKGGQP